MTDKRPTALLTIGGFDPSGGAGITVDLPILSRFGHACSIITVITYQNPKEVRGDFPLPAVAVEEQFTAVLNHFRIVAVKVGLPGTVETIHLLMRFLAPLKGIPIVVDPICISSSGYRFMDGEIREALLTLLLPLATAITPNLPELAELTGLPTASRWEEITAARELISHGVDGVVVTGGHRDGKPDDVVITETGVAVVPGIRRPDFPAHGGGCRHSSALAGMLSRGIPLVEAAREARELITSGRP
jgi:hydroxymethylpyrimidine/phosphomethylpyrimidine kinase